MFRQTKSFLAVLIAVVVGVLLVSACSSSGGGSSSKVSESQLESKLKSEPQIKTVLQQAGSKKPVVSQVVTCMAQALEKDASQSDLKKYVDGKLNLNDVGAKGKGATNAAANQVKSCTQNVAASASASASGSASG
jgi:hypothetical protein